MFSYFIHAAVETEDRKKSDKFSNSVSLSAYLYTIETDAWQIVCDELGFDASCHRELAAELCFAVQKMEMKDKFIRDCAFNEDEADKFLRQLTKSFKINVVYKVKTLEQQIEFYRESVECL